MLPEQLTIQDDFPPVTYDQWRATVEADLKGAPFEKKLVTHTYEGIDIQPIYTRADAPAGADPHGLPGTPPYVRGAIAAGAVATGWDLRQEHAHPDLVEANKAILADLEGGVTSVLLRLDASARGGRDPDASDASEPDGLLAYRTQDLDAALAGVHLDMAGAALDAGAAFLPAAAQLMALWRQRGVATENATGALNADPIGVLAAEGALPCSAESALNQLSDLAAYTSQHLPRVAAITVNTAPYHKAGATAAQDIAFGAATGLEYLRALTAAGLSVDQAAGQMLFGMHIGTHHFLAIAKLRAARRVWDRVVEASGGSPSAAAMRIHARTSDRVLTHRDAHVNLLRNTVAVFAASLGGADTITSAPFDHLVGLPTAQSRRVARNTALILQEEAHLNRVIDPAGGSWFLDNLTDQLANCAWGALQEIERQGGMLAALKSGWVAEQIDSAYAPRAKDIAVRKEGITGVSEFPNVAETPVETPRADAATLRGQAVQKAKQAQATGVEATTVDALIDAAAAGASIGQMAAALGFYQQGEEIAPLEARSFAEPFEQLRDASDVWLAKHGSRPLVFLANLGPIAHHTARATYSKNFFEAGG
ncbi:MAG: methylmalonyl-CoA mutase subunit beta, partial [Planctomycetales bacterium]|nr:methylmalonyl-CoA mutase subunit beta [Planctomycetales bacterium]